MSYYDVVVIGAGPSGLMAAMELAGKTNLSICILDKGQSVSKRVCNLVNRGKCLDCLSCGLVEGIGGAGLFSDGKLSVSNYVGERLEGLSSEFTIDVAHHVDSILKNEGTIKPKLSKEMGKVKKLASSWGLRYEYYDVRGLEHHKHRTVISEIERTLMDQGACILDNSHVTDLRRKAGGKWKVLFSRRGSEETIHTRYLLVGVGRSGATWFLAQARKLRIETSPTPFYLGLRIETDKDVMKPLTKLSYNPKLSIGIKGKKYAKTHCFCEGGTVVSYCYDNARFVGGFSNAGDKTSFSILVEQETPKGYTTHEYSNWLVSLINQVAKRKISLQRLGDFRNSKCSKEGDIRSNKIQPTLRDYSLANISAMFPRSLTLLILEFIKKINHICPGLDDSSTLVYAPALEWCVDKFLVNNNMQTNLRNLYAIGDGSGTTQGIIAAAATGLIAARNIVTRSRS